MHDMHALLLPLRPLAAEYCPRGSLYDLLRAARTDRQLAKKLTWHRRLSMLIDAAMGMLYL